MYRLRTRITCVNFIKIVQGTRPLGAIILVKFEFFSVLGAVKPHPWTDQGQILQGGAPPCQMWPWSVQRVAPAGWKNPKIGPWVNEIPAELPAADPAGNYNKEIITVWLKRIIYTKKQQYLKKTIKTKKSDLSRFFGFLKTIKNQSLEKPSFPPLKYRLQRLSAAVDQKFLCVPQ